MHETGLINDQEYERARARRWASPKPRQPRQPLPAYVDLVRRQLARDYPADALQGAGLSVLSAMSPSAQA
jgi:penicillin-binding protein 1B